jgi:PAS domain S-box-containing protein
MALASSLIHAIDDAILVIDPESGAVLDANTAGYRLFGCEQAASGALNLAELVEDVQMSALAPLGELALDGSLRAEWRAAAQDGERWLEANAHKIRIEGCCVVVAILRDVTARKEMEHELVHIREALDDSADAVVAVNRDVRATYLNVAFGNTFGYTRDTATEVDLLRIFADEATGREVIDTILAGGSWESEVQLVTRDGRKFSAELRGTPVLNDDFDVVAALFMTKDVTERKNLEAQVIQSQNLKSVGQLAAGIAHEINTPMQYVGDNLRFLDEAYQDVLKVLAAYGVLADAARAAGLLPDEVAAVDEAADENDIEYLAEEVPTAIGQSLEGAERVTEIVRAMRQFTHPGTGEKKTIDLHQAIESTITVTRNEWRYAAEVKTEFAPDMPQVPCLPGDLNQVILNLIVNAAHAIADVKGDSEQKGTITIATAHDSEWAEVRVSDTGTGIPPENRDRIFEPFFTTKEVGKGTGQGLAISHSVIVEKHGGQLNVESEPGAGTSFIIRLPLAGEEPLVEDEAARLAGETGRAPE